MNSWHVAIAGFGRVGWHVAHLLDQRRERYREQYGIDVRVVAVMGSWAGLYDPDGLKWDRLRPLTRENGGVGAAPGASADYTGPDFLGQLKADVLIETGPTDCETGGPAYTYLRTALSRGMHAIAVSKGALVFDYPGLAELARTHKVQLKGSGATAAALPALDLLEHNLAGSRVEELAGILTGTANYVLTRITEDGVSLSEAVAEAQQRGMAEPDPSFDLGGWDTACKLVILANAGLGASLRLSDVSVEGVDSRAAELARALRAKGQVIKLVGRIRRTEEGLTASVRPEALPADHPLACVYGANKAVWVRSDDLGDLFVSGGRSDPRAAAASALKDLEHILRLCR